MQNLFIKETDEIIVELAIAIEKGEMFCDVSEKSLRETLLKNSKLKNSKDIPIEVYQIKIKIPSFGDTISLYKAITDASDNVDGPVNPFAVNLEKIIRLVKEWNLTEDGSFKKPTEKEIKALNPVVAMGIAFQIDDATGRVMA